MRVFLTGGTGFLGSYVAEALIRSGHEVFCLVRSGNPAARLAPLRDRLTLVDGDLRDADGLARALEAVRPEALCHLAWQGIFGADRDSPRQAENIALTANLTGAALAAGAGAVIGFGSQAEYGPLHGIAREDDALNPTTLYGAAKVAAADFAGRICAQRGARFAWLRVFSAYGPGDSENWMIPSLILKLVRGERPALTAGEQRWEFLHAADAARATVAVLDTPSASGVFNLGSGDAPPLRHTIETIRDLIDPALALGFGEVPYRPGQAMHLEADIGRITRATAWTPAIPLREGLAETVAWYRRGRAQ